MGFNNYSQPLCIFSNFGFIVKQENPMKLLSILTLTIGLLFGAFCSDKPESMTKEQAEKLADRIMENMSSQNRHLASDSKWVATEFEWIVLEDIKGNPEILNIAILERAKKKFQIFNERKDIPEELKTYKDVEFAENARGYVFSYKATFNSANSITVNFKQYIGVPKEALLSWQRQYIWNGKEWIKSK